MDLSSLRGGVAVVTGGASGLGLEMARRARRLGMHLVIADLREDALAPAVADLQADSGGRVVGVTCDVTRLDSVEALLESTRSAFPGEPIQFVAANAGVIFPKCSVLSGSTEEWDRTLRANVLGVFHTLRTFVPVLVAQPQRSVVEITASMAALSYGGVGPYGPSKHAALAVAEALHRELGCMEGSPLDRIAIVALCPGLVNTALMDTSATQAGGSVHGDAWAPPAAGTSDRLVRVLQDRRNWERGLTPEFVADEVFKHAAAGKFYCILSTDGASAKGAEVGMRARLDSMIDRRLHPKL